MKELLDQLTALYEGDDVLRVFTRVQEILHNYRTRIPACNGEITEHDSLLTPMTIRFKPKTKNRWKRMQLSR